MDISVIIVNYNVRHFLEQCLRSVQKSIKNLQVEIFVVDNNSADGSMQMVKQNFPTVKIIENNKNVGFSSANNQAIKLSSGKYVLLLNPDTVIEEDTLTKTFNFMQAHPDAGGLGVKMIDGSGKFLPESKRGLPTPWIAFYKIFGLSYLFPKSKKFGHYHLTYLDNNKTSSVEVLAGAFMLLRKTTLDKIGLLDETFFMYGEDIDLSYRITKGGYKNYYFPDTTIIHYKGESTKKNSINYVLVFYNAMLIFARKHFSSTRASVYFYLIKLAILFTASVSILKRLFKKVVFPIIDALVLWGGIALITPIWGNIQFGSVNWLPSWYNLIVSPSYILIWIISLFYSGGYDRPYKSHNIYIGILLGTAFIFISYALLPENLRFSRMMLINGTIWALVSLPTLRILYNKLNIKQFKKSSKINAIIIGTNEAYTQTKPLVTNINDFNLLGYVSISNKKEINAIGDLKKLNEIIRINNINQIIFSSENLPSSKIIELMIKYGKPGMTFKIASPDGITLIGSSSITTLDNLLDIQVNSISTPKNKRFKRTIDILISLIFIILYPFIAFYTKNKLQLLKNIILTLVGKYTIVGFEETNTSQELPKLKKGILTLAMLYNYNTLSDIKKTKINLIYAKDYKMITDINIILKKWRNMDKNIQ